MSQNNNRQHRSDDKPSTYKGFKSFEVQEPMTRRIASILNDYADGPQIARELLQNSEDAGSTKQWYLLDHRTHPSESMFEKGLEEHMGPALLSGNDSSFQEKDFHSLMNLADSGKKGDYEKIGQMGIGFNSVYHMTDCPSFLSQDQLVILEPHAKIFNGRNTEFRGGVRGDFVSDRAGLKKFPDQIKPFAAKDDNLDLAAPYDGTIFRFPLRTQASEISSSAYSVEQARDMLMAFKEEALECLLFLTHVDQISIYERKIGDSEPTLLFDLQITNADEVRTKRKRFTDALKDHLDINSGDQEPSSLDYSIRPKFKLTDEAGHVTFETWQITSMLGSATEAHQAMRKRTEADPTAHRLIPWVGIAAPVDPKIKIKNSRLFCFLPIRSSNLFPVHINGHFAVKQSRREIWTNQDKDLPSKSEARLKAHWNEYMMTELVPRVYARFLENMGLDHGTDYSLWPVPNESNDESYALMREMSIRMLEHAIRERRKIFRIGNPASKEVVVFQNCYIADHVLGKSPLLVDILHQMMGLVMGLPGHIFTSLETVANSASIMQQERILNPGRVRDQLLQNVELFSDASTSAAKSETLEYCCGDGKIGNLEGLPLLPMADGSWAKFSKKAKSTCFLVGSLEYEILAFSKAGIIRLNEPKFPYGIIAGQKFEQFFTRGIPPDAFVQKVRDSFDEHHENDTSDFPTDKWLSQLWKYLETHKQLITQLEGLHLLRITDNKLAPLDEDNPVLVFDEQAFQSASVLKNLKDTLDILDRQLGYSVLAKGQSGPVTLAGDYLVKITTVSKVLSILYPVSPSKLAALSQNHRKVLSQYIQSHLPLGQSFNTNQLAALRKLPIFLGYIGTELKSFAMLARDHGSTTYICRDFLFSDLPWMPSGITLFRRGQDLQSVLQNVLKVRTMDEHQYWSLLLPNLSQLPEADWDRIIGAFAQKFSSHSDHYSFSFLKDLQFVSARGPHPGTQTRRIRPQDVVSTTLEELYVQGEVVFPKGIYTNRPILTMLQSLEMTTVFSEALAKERILTISGGNHSNGGSVIKAAAALLRTLKSLNTYSESLSATIQNNRWIPGSISTNPYSFSLYMPKECRPFDDKVLLGDTMPAVDIQYPSQALRKAFGWDRQPPLARVLEHLSKLIKVGSGNSGIGQPDEASLRAIYQDLLGRVRDPTALETIKEAVGSQKWILVNKKLYATDRVAFSMPSFLAPRLVQLPSTILDPLFRALGVPESVEVNDLQGLIRELAEQYGEDMPLSEEDALLVARILEHIAATPPNSGEHGDLSELLILTQDSKLCRIDKVVYDDVNASQESSDIWGDSDEETYTTASLKISHDVATKLNITMLSTQYWHAKKDPDLEPWAQQEDIVDRIRNILNDYDPSSIFQEFLQNAEDAGATKCIFKLEERSYGTKSILCPEMAACQGPALIIYNDAELTKDDFRALCKLGVGNKRGDSTKIGRHGLGFNSAYHFTDIPSVVSGTHIGFFDPHRVHLPKSRTSKGLVAEGGVRVDFRKLKGPTYADQLAPYKGLFGCDMESHFKGTIFRLPLRTANRPYFPKIESSLGESAWTISRIGNTMSDWKQDAKVTMLFLKNLKTIELQGSGYPCTVTKSNTTEGSALDTIGAWSALGTEIATVINIRHNLGNATRSNDQEWLVYQESQFPTNVPESIVKLAKDNRWTAHRGTAFPLRRRDQTDESFKEVTQGRLFTHLPTPIRTETKFHIHGGFALSSNRKGLAGGSVSTRDSRALWNESLRKTMIPLHLVKAFTVLLEYLIANNPKKTIRDLEATQDKYFAYLPTLTTMEKEAILDGTEFWSLTYHHDVFPCRGADHQLIAKSAQQSTFTNTQFPPLPRDLQRNVVQLLVSSGKHICEFPPTPLRKVKDASNLPCNEVTAALVRDCLSTHPGFLSDEIKSTELRTQLLEYILVDMVDPDIDVYPSVSRLAVIPLPNGEWKTPSSGVTHYTAKPSMRALIKGDGSLIVESIFCTPTLQRILNKFVEDRRYDVQVISPEHFTEIFCKENPRALDNYLVEKVWGFLREYADLSPFGNLRVLRTVWGDLKPLNSTKHGLILESYSTPASCQALRPLLTQREVPVFSASSHQSHPGAPKDRPFNSANVFKELGRTKGWERTYLFKTDEAATLRTWVMANEVPHDLRGFVGGFKIWNSYCSSTPLIRASGSVFQAANGNADLSCFGRFPTIINLEGQNSISNSSSILSQLGAQPADVRSILLQYVIPTLQARSGNMTQLQKITYRNILASLWSTTGDRPSLSMVPVIPRKTGGFAEGRNLFNPDDDLLRSLFNDQDEMFPDETIWQEVRYLHAGGPFGLQTSNDHATLRRCAEQLLVKIALLPVERRTLSLTVTAATSSPELCGLAVNLVRKIYAMSSSSHMVGQTNWCDGKWAIVPAELATDPVQSLKVPSGLPTFMAISRLRWGVLKDETWTNCAYFPADLEPPAQFMAVYPGVANALTEDIILHFRTLVRELAPAWTSMSQQLMLKTSLFKLYQRFENDVQEDSSRIRLLDLLNSKLKDTPYILNGDHLDPALPLSWRKPSQVVLDIEHDMDHEQPVHSKLLVYRNFLVAVGVREIKKVEGHKVEVPPGRELGVLEKNLVELFEKQDSLMGFMDVKFTFSDPSRGPGLATQPILAHKFVLAHTCEHFSMRFTGAWSQFTTSDPTNPGLAVVDMSRAIATEEKYDAFWGVLYYLYTDKLIHTNGPPSATVAATEEGTESSESVKLRNDERVKYLVELLTAAELYCLERLKSLIARALMPPSSLINYSNAFDIRRCAREASQADLIAFCAEFIQKNCSLMKDQVRVEIRKVTEEIQRVKDDIQSVKKDIRRMEEVADRELDNSETLAEKMEELEELKRELLNYQDQLQDFAGLEMYAFEE